MTRVSAEAVRRVMENPPVWLAASYISAYKSGRYSLEVLALGVVAALGIPIRDPLRFSKQSLSDSG